MWSQKVLRLDDSLLPRRLLPAGLGRAEEEGQPLLLQRLLRQPPCQWRRLPVDREDCSCYWLSPGLLAMPTMLYYVAVSGAKLPTVSDQRNTKTRHV